MYAIPCPLEKFVARRPIMLMPAVTAAAACSPSGSKKSSRRPLTFGRPCATASAQPSPICVDGVIGYAPAPSLAAVSISTTAVLPSRAVRTPGYFTATGSGVGRLRANSFIRTPGSRRLGAPIHELHTVHPHDRVRGAPPRRRRIGEGVLRVIDDRETVRHLDQPGRGVDGTAAARVAGRGAERIGRRPLEQAAALDNQLLLGRHQREE